MGVGVDLQEASGGALSRHHVRRPQLVGQLEAAHVGLIAAGGGYGKTMLGAELAHQLGLASVSVLLGPADHQPAALLARLHSALRRAHLSELASAVQVERGDPAASVDALGMALEREPEPVLLVVDDVHHVSEEAGDLLARFATVLPDGHRLLVLGRHLPPRLGERGRPGTVSLTAEQLSFAPGEVVELFSRGFDLAITEADARALVHATAGWAAALVLAARALASCERPDEMLHEIIERRRPLHHLIDRQLAALSGEHRAALAQLAHLPLLSPAVVEAATGDPMLLQSVGVTGLPLSVRPDGWWELPGPVQEQIARRGSLRAATALAVAPVYARHGELASAVQVLLSAAQAEAAAALLADMSPQQADDLGYLELQMLVDSLPAGAVRQHPGLLVHLARTCEPAAEVRLRAQALDRAGDLARGLGDEQLMRAVGAELARDLVRDGRADEAEALASEVLSQVGAGELATRARTLDVLGRAAAWRRDERSLATAERLLTEAHTLCLRLGQRAWASQVVMPLAHGVLYARGDHEAAIQWIERTLDELPGRSRHRGVMLNFYADILIDCGRFAEAEAAVGEEWRLGETLRDQRISAYAAWSGARLASQAGDRERTVAWIRAVESHRHDWFGHSSGADFLADAADLLDRVGETKHALLYLERARARRTEGPLNFAIGQAAVLARSGDAEEAERVFLEIERLPRLEPRERWRITLLRAYAALRRGDGGAGRLAAEAFEFAAQVGKPELPLVRDRAVAEQLIGLAVTSGSAAAAQLEQAGRPLMISVLGRFELRRGGEPVSLPTGKPEQLVKLLAVSGGRMPAEQAIEELWPEVDPQSGRKRLRNVLNRLHAVAPDVAIRAGDVLTLGDAEVDAEQFEQHARRVLHDPDGAHARIVLARYRGSLLPEDRYEPWAAAARERLQRLYLALLDTAAAGAESAGEVDEALRFIDRALELEPYDEQRYLRGARLLLAQGRRAAALSLLQRSAAALEALGVPTSAAHDELVAATRR